MKRWMLWCLSVMLSSGLWSEAMAAVPQLIRYQGTLVDTQQVPLEGPYTVTFRLYDAATGGTKVWEETQTNVPCTKGQFSVLLGQVTPLELAFDKTLWLSIQVNTDAEMSPRQRLSSVPYAYRAEVAENTKTSAIQDDAYRFVPSGIIVLSPGPSCPSGYTRFAAMDGKFLVAGAAYTPAAGGSNTHTHSAGSLAVGSHTHQVTISRGGWGAVSEDQGQGILNTGQLEVQATGDRTFTTSSSSASVTGTSDAADSRPEFATVLLCQKQ